MAIREMSMSELWSKVSNGCKRPRSKRRKHEFQLKESSAKKRRVKFEPLTEPALPWKKELQKQEVASDDVLHQKSYYRKSYETKFHSKAPDLLSGLLSHDRTDVRNSDKQLLDVKFTNLASEHGSKKNFIKRETTERGAAKKLLDIWPKEELAEPELGKTIQWKSSSSYDQNSRNLQLLDAKFTSVVSEHESNDKYVKRETFKRGTAKQLLDIWPKEELAEPELGKTIQGKSSSSYDQNSRSLQSRDGTKPLLLPPPCDFQSNKTRLKVENCSRSWKAGKNSKSLTELELDHLVDSLKFKLRQSNVPCTSNKSEKCGRSVSNCSVQSDKSSNTDSHSEWKYLKDDLIKIPSMSREDFSVDDEKFQSRDDFSSEDNSLKRKLLLFENFNDATSSEDDLDAELPDLADLADAADARLLNEPLRTVPPAENVNEPKIFAKSVQRISSSRLLTFDDPVKTKTKPLFTEVGCSTARDKCHTYLEFPPFLPGPSSNSSLQHCRGDCGATGPHPNWSAVSVFSPSKVSIVMDILDAFELNTWSRGNHRRRSKQGPVCEEHQDEGVCFPDTSRRLVSSVFRNLTTFKSQPTVRLIATLLRHLTFTTTPGDSHSLHRALKGAWCLHPHRNTLPFDSKMLFQVLETVLDGSQPPHSGSILCLDFMVTCLETEFLVNFQTIGLRRMRKTKLFDLFNSSSALRNLQTRLLVACQRHDPADRNPVRVLPLLQRLLAVAGGVVIAGVDGVARVASMVIGEYESCGELSVRVALLESVSFPFHRFAMVRQLLERWRSRSMSRSLRSLMFPDVGALLDSYFSDRFLSGLVMNGEGRMSVERAEELAMLLYTLVESYIHTKRDCVTSPYWKKIGLSDERTENDLDDLGPLSLLPGYVDRLRSFLEMHLSPHDRLSRKTNLYLIKLDCLADLCIQQ